MIKPYIGSVLLRKYLRTPYYPRYQHNHIKALHPGRIIAEFYMVKLQKVRYQLSHLLRLVDYYVKIFLPALFIGGYPVPKSLSVSGNQGYGCFKLVGYI